MGEGGYERARKTRSDALGQDVIDDIESCAFTHLPTSPCAKDEVRRKVSVGHFETRRTLFRFLTWDEYWLVFRKAQHLASPMSS
jgi:hypothetical protein